MKKITSFMLALVLAITGLSVSWAETLTIPANVVTISREAFMGDTSLDQVIIRDGAYSIGELAFANSSLSAIELPNSVKYISDDAFLGSEDVVIYSDYSAYARSYAIEHDIPWGNLKQWQREKLLDLVDETDEEELEDVDLSDMDFSLLSTKGITDSKLAVIYEAFNNAQLEAQSIMQDIAAAGDELLQILDQIDDEQAELLSSISDNGINIGGIQWNMSADILEQLPSDMSPVAIYPDTEADAVVIEADRQGTPAYFYINENGLSVIPVSRAMKLKQRRAASTSSDSAPDTSKLSMLSAVAQTVVSGINGWVSNVFEIMAKLKKGWTDEAKALETANESLKLGMEYMVETKNANPNDLNFQAFAEQQLSEMNKKQFANEKNIKLKNNASKAVGKLNALFGPVNLFAILSAVEDDISAANNIIIWNGHGHPTEKEQEDPEVLELANQFNVDIIAAMWTVFGDTCMNLMDLASCIDTILTPVQALLGPAGIGTKLLASVAIASAKKLVKELTKWLCGVAIGLSMQQAMNNLQNVHYMIHYHSGVMVITPEPTTPTPPPETPTPAPEPEIDFVIPGQTDPVIGEDVELNSINFPDPGLRSWAQRFDQNNDGILTASERLNPPFIYYFDPDRFYSPNYENEVISLAGIEYFPNLTSIEVTNYQGTSLDLRVLPHLQEIKCSYSHNLEELFIQGMTELEKVECEGCKLVTLDASGCSALNSLNVSRNQLQKIRLDGCASLTNLDCSENQLTTLDFLDCVALESLDCSKNNLNSLDLSICGSLNYLECSNNLLKTLDLHGTLAIEKIWCANNYLTEWDSSGLKLLESFDCHNNQIKVINCSGCVSLKDFQSYLNPMEELNLSNCTSLSQVYIEYDPHVQSTDLQTLKSINLSGCSALEEALLYSENSLTDLDISGCSALKTLHLYNSKLSQLDLSDNVSLQSLTLDENQLTMLDVSHCPELQELKCDRNQIESLILGNNTKLITLYCSENPLKSLDVSGCAALQNLSCNETSISRLDVSGLEQLSSLSCGDGNNRLYALKILNCKSLEYLHISSRNVIILNTKGCDLLEIDNIHCFPETYIIK